MHFFIMLILFKIALTLLFFTLGAYLIAEFFPILADKAVAASSGTALAPVGDILSQALHFIARYAQMFVDIVFSWLRAFGIPIDAGAVKDGVRNADLKAPGKVEKPQF